MFPTFFHLDSHLWIFYSLILNGLLLDFLFKCYSKNYKNLTSSFEATCLAAFFISIGINALALKFLDALGVDFLLYSKAYPFWILFLIGAFFLCIFKLKASLIQFEVSWYRATFYIFVFIVMFYNGGLIELIADSWWHMSFANKIAYFNSYTLEKGHLDGITNRYYPPLWHANLAFVKIQSSLALPVIWNSVTAWAAVLKLMAFYLFAKQLTANEKAAFVSIILFTLLPGLHNSYFRLSAWPSQIAYTQLYALFYLFFYLLFDNDKYAEKVSFTSSSLRLYARREKVAFIAAIYVFSLIVFTHLLEVVWFYLATLISSIVYILLNNKVNEAGRINKNRLILGLVSLSSIVVAIIFTVFRLIDSWSVVSNNIDLLVTYIFILLLLSYSFLLGLMWLSKSVSVKGPLIKVTGALIFVVLLMMVDWQHFVALFLPSFEYVSPVRMQDPYQVTGWLGGALSLPSWNFQLREGLLYSCVFSLLISVWLLLRKVSFTNCFLMATALFAFLICISPYLYYFFERTMVYSSVWRVTVLIFHPIIYAQFIREIMSNDKVRIER